MNSESPSGSSGKEAASRHAWVRLFYSLTTQAGRFASGWRDLPAASFAGLDYAEISPILAADPFVRCAHPLGDWATMEVVHRLDLGELTAAEVAALPPSDMSWITPSEPRRDRLVADIIRDEHGMLPRRMIKSGGRHGGLPTGFVDIDRMSDGLQPGYLTIIAGKPGMGRNSFARSLVLTTLFPAKPAPARSAVLVMSTRDNATDWLSMLIALKAEINLRKACAGFVSRECFPKIEAATQALADAPLSIGAGAIALPQLLATIVRWHATVEHPALIVVTDIRHVLDGDERPVDDRTAADTVRRLKRLAEKLMIPIVLITDVITNEDKALRDITLGAIRAGQAMRHHADLILAIDRVYSRETHRMSDDDDCDEDIGPGLVKREMLILQNPLGPLGEVPLFFNRVLCRFQTPECPPQRGY